MPSSILVVFHISTATVGLLSGFMAMVFRKGSGLHGAAGSIFFPSMLCMSASAAYMAAFMRPNMLNVIAGLLTFYLVATGWRAAKRREDVVGPFDVGALLFVSMVGAAGAAFGLEASKSPAGLKDGMPAGPYFVFGFVALLCAVSDVRMLVRGSLFGVHRIARHLWRMCLGLLIATLSFFPGQARNLPESFGETKLIYLPHVLLIGSMIYWLFRVRVRKSVRRGKVIGTNHGEAAVEKVVSA